MESIQKNSYVVRTVQSMILVSVTQNLLTNRNSRMIGWWFQPLWTILVNGKDYPIYYGKIQKKNQTTNQNVYSVPIV